MSSYLGVVPYAKPEGTWFFHNGPNDHMQFIIMYEGDEIRIPQEDVVISEDGLVTIYGEEFLNSDHKSIYLFLKVRRRKEKIKEILDV